MRLLLSLGVAALVVAAAPRSTPPPVDVASVDTVDVTKTADTLQLRSYDRAVARVVDSIGRRKSTTVTWTVRDTNVVYISGRRTDSLGFYSVGIRSREDTGRTYLVAQAGTKKDSMLWVVRDSTCSETTLGSLNLAPDSSTAHRTDTLSFGLSPRNTCGHVMGGINPTWSSSDNALGTVARIDSFVGRAVVLDSAGTLYVKAVSGTVRDSVKVKLKHAP